MLGQALVSLAVTIAALLLGHFYYARKCRQRSMEVLGWIDGLLCGQGHIAGIKWQNSSSFCVPLRLRAHTFRNANLRVNLLPQKPPLTWIFRKLINKQETLVFEADLDWAPSFTLELQSYRLFARSRKNLTTESPGWDFEQATPFVLTTRKDWQKEITAVISSLLSCQDRQFLSIAFSQSSPHFSATLALDSISPTSTSRTEIFSSLRELATGASAPQI